MNHNVFRILFLSLALVAVASCGKRDGVIDDRMQIDNITATEKHFHNDMLYASRDTYVEEDWHWDGNELYRIDYHGGNPYSENFFYGSHQRLERTTVPAFGIRSEFFYDGRNLEHIDFYRNDELHQTVSVVHGEDHISEIECRYYSIDNSDAVKLFNPLASLLGSEVASKLETENRQRLDAQCKRGEKSLFTRYELSWSGDNVTAIKCVDADGTRKITIAYDNKRNPYCQLYGYRELNDPVFGFEMLSANNILSIRMPYLHNSDQLFSYSYVYKDKYPSRRTFTYSYPTVSGQTFDSVMYKYEKVEQFSYLD